MRIDVSVLATAVLVLIRAIAAEDVHGCYKKQIEFIKELGEAAPLYYWFPKCLPGGYYQNVQCNFFGCFCSYLDTGERIPNTLSNGYILFMRDYCPWVTKKAPDPCTLPPPDYPCKETSKKFYFNPQQGKCEESGTSCLGFGSMDACQKSCVVTKRNRCNFRMAKGIKCERRSSLTRWYHDENTNSCIPFQFEGCGGNSNNYIEKWNCLETCESTKEQKLIIDVENAKYLISLPSWFVIKENYSTSSVNKFSVQDFKGIEEYLLKISIYTLPDDEVKPTNSYPDYEKFRPEHADANISRSDICNMKKDPGPCRIYVPSWYFDAEQSKCIKFIYGGCFGNENRFQLASSCATFCDAKVKSEEDPFEVIFGNLGGLPVATTAKTVTDDEDDDDGMRNLDLNPPLPTRLVVGGAEEIGFSFEEDEFATTAAESSYETTTSSEYNATTVSHPDTTTTI